MSATRDGPPADGRLRATGEGPPGTGAGQSVRSRVRVEGTVQGVGFRPFVHRLATELALGGWVRNDRRGVELEVEGDPRAVEELLRRLPAEAPPLARIQKLTTGPRPPCGERDFAILASGSGGPADAPITADAGTCADCLRELFDPTDRRYRYPFINCTNCGPRFTIVRGLPYDRPQTTMAGFVMCDACRHEYEDPGDRRFHAQPNACPQCGPRVRLVGLRREGPGDLVSEAAGLLAAGAVLAVKGLGGFHLAVRADEQAVVARLRSRKHREDRPFALMVRDLPAARRLAAIGPQEAALLEGPARPIVLLPALPGAPVAAAVAPGIRELGLMLPYTPLHHLLLAEMGALGVGALVMTSGNISDEPICFEDADALARLAPVADAMLLHDRPIQTRTDDSVMRVVNLPGRRATLPLRRSRGLVPQALELPQGSAPALLACGAELKSTFCLARGGRAWVSHHIGDLRNWETLKAFRGGIGHFEELFTVRPRLIAHDLHPDYLSSGYASERAEREDLPRVGVQHHHAHLAAVLAEHDRPGAAVGAIFDGSGLGSDGTAWGGELLIGDLAGFVRAGHLLAVPLPGGDRAAREPWRMACAWLTQVWAEPAIPHALAGSVSDDRWRAVVRLATDPLATVTVTSSVGRLCDAIAALCGIRCEVTYEGQAAVELEALADRGERGAYELGWDGAVIDPRPAILAILEDLGRGMDPSRISARFHRGLAAATARACIDLAGRTGVEEAVLAGGVFQNRLLLEGVTRRLAREGLRVLIPERLPPGDGAISYGQAAVAGAASPRA